MPVKPTKGLHRVLGRPSKDGTRTVYTYLGKGGPRLPDPSDPAFEAAYEKAVKERGKRQAVETLAGLVKAYRGSPEFDDLAPSTKAKWAPVLDRIQETEGALAIGGLPISVLAEPRVKQHYLAFRDQWRNTPRTADYVMQVLSAVLTWGRGRGLIGSNVLLGREALYKSNRADLIWSDDEVRRFKEAAPSLEVSHIVLLACLTGLRRGDLLRLEWDHVGDFAIVIQPNKSRRRRRPRSVTIPLLDETLDLLKEIKAQQEARWLALAEAAERKGRPLPPVPTTVLTNTRCRPWTKDGAEHQVVDTKAKAGIDKHLHDCRGTFATRLRLDGATSSEIADILGWEEARVERLLALYVDTDQVVRAFAERIRARAASRRSHRQS